MSKFFILVPIYNFQYFIDICIRSILFQSYTNWYCILFDDGSTDKSKVVCNYYVKKYPNKFKYVKLDNKNNGGGYSKWHGIQEIKKLCNDNDIMIIIDGDDYLINKNALSIIHKRYLNTNCWGTFGSYEGKYSDMKHKVNMNNYSRKNWFFLAPRSCKCFLLKLFTSNDFKYENKEWLQKSTDVAFFCNIVEWSGIQNIQYIKDILYKYREHNRNGYKIMNPYMKKHKEYVCNLKEKDKYFYNNLLSNTNNNPEIFIVISFGKNGSSSIFNSIKMDKKFNDKLKLNKTETQHFNIFHLHTIESFKNILTNYKNNKINIIIPIRKDLKKQEVSKYFQYIKNKERLNKIKGKTHEEQFKKYLKEKQAVSFIDKNNNSFFIDFHTKIFNILNINSIIEPNNVYINNNIKTMIVFTEDLNENKKLLDFINSKELVLKNIRKKDINIDNNLIKLLDDNIINKINNFLIKNIRYII